MPYVAAILVVGLVIVIHELGHLLGAKLGGIPVERFSIGFGPRVVGFRWRETSYWLSAFPIGGYVLPALDEGDVRRVAFGRQLVFSLGGPLANVASAYLALAAFGGFSFATEQLGVQLTLLVRAIGALFAGSGELSGIVGIVAIGGSQYGTTLAGLAAFFVAISLNLGVLNLLPLPPLDGGRIVFSGLGTLFRPLRRIEIPVTLAGWALMLGVMIYATIHDIGRIGTLS